MLSSRTDPETGNTSEFSACIVVSAPPATCGDATGDGIVSATDALFALKAGVGTETCELCICDINGSGTLTSTDALLALKKGVGQDVALNCPACG